MKKLNVMKSSDLKESDKLLKSEEDFAGFDVNDEALIRIENSKQCVKNELSKEKGVPMEEDKKSTPIVNYNHVNNKKKQSKSSVSSPETNDTKHGRSSNKRIKKDDHVGTEAKESLESDASPSLDETEKLIDLVHNYPYLYDTSHCEYKNIVTKAEKWNEIAGILNLSSEAVKHKWKNLRDSYIKYIKFLKGSTGSAKKYQNWPWAAHLEFLNDTVVPRATTSNVAQTHEISHVDETGEQDETVDNEFIDTSPSQMRPPTKTLKRKEVTGDVDAVITYLQNKQKSKTNTKPDHIDNLFLSYAHTFKTFSPRTQAILKMEMSQLFGQAELNEVDALTRSSPVFSTTSSYSDSNSNVADNGNTIHSLNYSNLELSTDTPISSPSGLYQVSQSTRDIYENAAMFIDTQPNNTRTL